MLYPQSKTDKLDMNLFRTPTSEYRAAPFWAWNCEMTADLLKKEIEYLKEMGFGGFHMHPRVGLATPYLSDEFMALVSSCVKKAKDEKMLAWLYDEDKWPSGFAGGMNTKDIEKRQKSLYITNVPYNDGTLTVKEDINNSRPDTPKSKYYLLACYDVIFDENHCMRSYKRINQGDKADGMKLFAYVEYAAPTNWYNGQAYVDTLSKKAIEDFVKITHERYKEKIGDEFGKTVPSIFFDEPQSTIKTFLTTPDERGGIKLPYTTDFDETFKAAYGFSLLDKLPELMYELPNGKISRARYCYHDHAAERFAAAFADTIYDW